MWLEIALLHIFKKGECLWYMRVAQRLTKAFKAQGQDFYRLHNCLDIHI